MSVDLMRVDPMRRLDTCIGVAQDRFADLLRDCVGSGGCTIDQYVRYLSFQYHLTKGVQYYFLAIAAHPALAKRRALRRFLVHFADEEELHYLVAANDLDRLGHLPSSVPIDVQLWHAYFKSVVHERPFLRLGAACILENISAGSARSLVKQALAASFLKKDNTKFLVLHQHETLPHGDQLLRAIAGAELDDTHFDDLVAGARAGTVLYLRMAEWALRPNCHARLCDDKRCSIAADELAAIRSFAMRELEDA